MRFLRLSLMVVLMLVVAGDAFAGTCRNCGLVFEGKGVYCADCARRFEAERERAAKELVYVERVIRARRQYEKAVADLVAYYTAEGDARKADQAKHEKEDLGQVRKYDYILLAELLGPDLRPARSIAEADALYQDGLNYYNQFAWPSQKKRKYSLAMEKFTKLIKKYPESDRIDDAAYYLGRCCEKNSIRDYGQAILWYQRCYQWNPKTEHDPRYRVARVYDKKLGQRAKAVQFYNLVIRDSADEDCVQKAQGRIDALAKVAAAERVSAVTPPDEE